MSVALVVLALYGDLLKRVAPDKALPMLYSGAAIVLLLMILTGNRIRGRAVPTVSSLAALLISVYLAQLVTSTSQDMYKALQAVAYLCIPMGFLYVIPRFYPQFDFAGLALYTALFMIPIHLVGLAQQFVDQTFLIDTSYTQFGGIIERNLFDGGLFRRFPSLFVSADRYSGLAMMQILLVFVIASRSSPVSWKLSIWILLNLVLGGASLGIAGARSRIIIVGVALLVAACVFVSGGLSGRLRAQSAQNAWRMLVVLSLWLVAVVTTGHKLENVIDSPLAVMLRQTLDHGDIQARLSQAIEVSVIPDNVALVGEGMGVAGGRPGEFGIRAMWIESGLFWTPIMLSLYAAIALWLVRLAWRAAMEVDATRTLVSVGTLLAWIFGLLAGLSSSFELSQALLLIPTIAGLSLLQHAAADSSRSNPIVVGIRRINVAKLSNGPKTTLRPR